MLCRVATLYPRVGMQQSNTIAEQLLQSKVAPSLARASYIDINV